MQYPKRKNKKSTLIKGFKVNSSIFNKFQNGFEKLITLDKDFAAMNVRHGYQLNDNPRAKRVAQGAIGHPPEKKIHL